MTATRGQLLNLAEKFEQAGFAEEQIDPDHDLKCLKPGEDSQDLQEQRPSWAPSV